MTIFNHIRSEIVLYIRFATAYLSKMKNPRQTTMAVRITLPFKKVIEEYMQRDSHVSPSDLLRDALREKIEREAPDLLKRLHEGDFK